MPLRRLERLLATSPRCLLSRSSGYFENIGLKSSPAKSSSAGDSSFGRAHQSGASAARFSQPECNFEFAARVRPTEQPRACQGDESRKSRRRFRSCIANGAMDGRSVCCGRVDEFCAGARRLVGGACGDNAVRGCKMAQALRHQAGTLRLVCARTDWPMRHFARKFGARLDLVLGQLVADIPLGQRIHEQHRASSPG
jgi:hypothetical protein